MKRFDEAGERLALLMVEAFRPYLEQRLAEHGYPPVPEAVVEGAAGQFAEALSALVSQPAAQQRQSPLQLFQAALAAPNEALREAGVPAPSRDEAAIRALPGDIYDLAPASSAALGDAVWEAHLAWGAAKAHAMRSRSVVMLTSNLMDRSRIEGIATAHGLVLEPVSTAAGLEQSLGRSPVQVLIDLAHPEAEQAISAAAAYRVVAFGPHVDADAMARARMLGADQVMSRSAFFRQSDSVIAGSI